MKIAIDIDEVLADFANPLDDYIQAKYKVKMDRHKWNTADWWQTWGGSKTTAIGKIFEFSQSQGFADLPVIPGALDGVKKLKDMGHELVVITGRPLEWMDQTKAWLDKHFPGMFERVESTDFHMAKGGHKNKGMIARDLGCDILIDDFPHYAEEANLNGVTVLLFDSGFNHGYPEHDRIRRVKGWEEAVAEIGELSNKK
jgi:5'(3')-deoxyribonucleotidase